MATLNFFAVREDFIAIFDNIFANTGIQVFEMYSEYDQALRRFRSTEQILSALPVGYDKFGNGKNHLLSLWSPSVTAEPAIERIDFNGKVEGHTHRFTVRGWGLMQLYSGGVFENIITPSYFGHNSQQRAARWNCQEEVNWSESRKLSNKILYLVGKKLKAARASTRPVLRGALELHKQGYLLKEDKQVYELIPDAAPIVHENALVRYNQPL